MSEKTALFERNVPGSTKKLQMATVGVAGCGGLGSNAAVSLVRAGVGRLILADGDQVELSNLNRQHYFQTDVGQSKVDALSAHLKAINPKVRLRTHNRILTPEDVPVIFSEADVLIEAFDKGENKHWLIESWCKAFPDKPIVVGSGLSGMGNTRALTVRKAGTVYFCGDGVSDMGMGLCSARVAIAANMEANVAVALLTGSKEI